MARPKYRITPDDAWYAYEWLKKTEPSEALVAWMQRWVNSADDDQSTLADELHEYADARLDDMAWTCLKNAIRRRKANEGADLVSTRLPSDVVSMINHIVELDGACATQADALKKHLSPVLKKLNDAKRSQLHAYWLDEYANWPVQELAAFALKLSKWSTIHGRGLAAELETISPSKAVFTRLLARIPLPESNELLEKFQVEKGKWVGLAKRKWPELKEDI
jgi:hypothetical protein